jgi:hypothetical protein
MARHMSSELAREVGKLGGRPKGSLSPNTIRAIKTKEAMIKEIEKQTGRIVNNLLLGSDRLDTSASKELFERAFGKVTQGVDMRVAQFSLKELAEYRKELQKGVELE